MHGKPTGKSKDYYNFLDADKINHKIDMSGNIFCFKKIHINIFIFRL